MRLQQLLFALLSNRLTAAVSCGSTTVTSQADADVINTACPTVTGDVILATDAAGSINFDGIQVIDGNLVTENCSHNCSSFTSLSSSTLVSVSQNISLQSLSNLGSISFPGLQTVGGQLYLDSLPDLQNMSIYNLSTVGQFHLATAPNLVYMNLSQLRNVTGQDPTIEIIGVGLSDLQGLNVGTSLSNFILRDSPKVLGLTLSTPQIGYLEISLNESTVYMQGFSFSTSLGADSIQSISTLNMSGCNSFAANSPTIFNNLILSQNTFSYLYLNPVKVTNNLSIVDNPLLRQALLPTDMSIQNIEIRGNDILQSQQIVAGTDSWPWGVKNASSMILDGSFEPVFFHAFNNLTLIEVSKDFFLKSNDLSFDCKTVAAGHIRTTAGSSGSIISTPLLSIFAGVTLSVIGSIL